MALEMTQAPIRVLAVDDRQDNLLAITAALRSPDYELVTVQSGQEALRYLLDHECALILMDVQMPEMDGYECVRLIKQSPRSRETPVIFLTAINKDKVYVDRGYAGGAVDYILKPFDPEVLRAKVAVFAQLYRSKQQILRQAELIREHENAEKRRALADLELRSMRREHVLQERYRELVNGIGNAIIWSCTAGSLEATFVSPSTREILGLHADACLGAALFYERVLPDDRPWVHQTLRRVAELGRPAVFEHRLLRADGTSAWVQTSARLSQPEEGRTELHGLSVDLTKQKAAEDALRLLAQAGIELSGSLDAEDILDRLFGVVVPTLADWCIAELHEPGNVSHPSQVRGHGVASWDGPMKAYCALEPALPLGPRREVHAGPDRPMLASTVPSSMLDELTHSPAQRERLAALAPASWMSLPLVVRGIQLGTLVLARTRTESRYDAAALELAEELARRVAHAIDNARLYREAQESVSLREDFLSIASHELRTPLTPLKLQISSLEKLLRQEGLPAEVRAEASRKLAATQRQIDRLTKLVESLLDVSRIRTGRLELELEELDLAVLVPEVIGRFREELLRHKIDVSTRFDGVLRGMWDRSRLDQVITNLVSNAIKYGNRKPVEIRATCQGDAVLITVEDHGIGIDGQNPERVFHRFERAVDVRSYGGLGLGLYIVRQLVEAHGGTVTVATRPGLGSAFTLKLPTRVTQREPTSAADPVSTEGDEATSARQSSRA